MDSLTFVHVSHGMLVGCPDAEWQCKWRTWESAARSGGQTCFYTFAYAFGTESYLLRGLTDGYRNSQYGGAVPFCAHRISDTHKVILAECVSSVASVTHAEQAKVYEGQRGLCHEWLTLM
jgi:hypothetical protein